jgi:glycosyltransferase involved in cell wall biosynthesis
MCSFIFLCLFFASFSYAADLITEKEIVIIIPSFNNIQWYQQNLDSVIEQHYSNWSAIYIDDCSPDGTGEVVKSYIHEKNMENKITLIPNEHRMGALCNIFNSISKCHDEAIIVTLDGDDWFAHNKVLERINKEYSDPDVWMTYGSYMVYPDKTVGAWQQIPDSIIRANGFRQAKWVSSHLRTFYAKLFKLIKKEDLLHENQFFKVTWDMAFMFPMLEMAGTHSRHISEILYVYNQSNPINDFKINLPLVLSMDKLIRSKSKYSPLLIP